MVEIIVSLILQIATILNGGDAEKAKAEQNVKTQKTEQSSTTNSTAEDGGQGGWTGQ